MIRFGTLASDVHGNTALSDHGSRTTDHGPRIAVAFDRPADRDAADALATQLRLPLAKKFRDPHDLHLTLAEAGEGRRLELRVVAEAHPLCGGHGVASDLLKLDVTSPAGRSLRTPVLKAAGVKRGQTRPRVLDVTAGLGEDSWLLAAAGCHVVAVERHPVIHALLADGLRRAAEHDPETARRITLKPPQDALAALAATGSDAAQDAADVVLIDPMFPGPRKTAERKAMAVLRWVAGDDPDADNLLDPALIRAIRRVVVKRPRAAPPLNGHAPTVVHGGRGLRFDVYAGADLSGPATEAAQHPPISGESGFGLGR